MKRKHVVFVSVILVLVVASVAAIVVGVSGFFKPDNSNEPSTSKTPVLAGLATSEIPAWRSEAIGIRPIYTAEEAATQLGGTAMINCITDGAFGDERAFMRVEKANGDQPNVDANGIILVENGDTYIISAIVMNDVADTSTAGLRAAFFIPVQESQQASVSSYLSSDAFPFGTIKDLVAFRAEGFDFVLKYHYGESELIVKDGKKTIALGDEIVTRAASEGGVLIGSNDADGILKGGQKNLAIVRVTVTVVGTISHEVVLKYRHQGEQQWLLPSDGFQTTAGDLIEFQGSYRNVSGSAQANVMALNELPAGLEYVPGSTTLFNAMNPDGTPVADDSWMTQGLNLGKYEDSANAYVRFTCKVVDFGEEGCLTDWFSILVGSKRMRNSASLYPAE